jgi:hypothetical protein
MNVPEFDWRVPPLSAEDERLVEAYERIGVPLDALPYTKEFKSLVERLGVEDSETKMHEIWLRLLMLRKKGQLPRTYGVRSQ